MNERAASRSDAKVQTNPGALRRALLIGLFGAGSYLLGTYYPPEMLHLLITPPAIPIPVEGSAEADAYIKQLEKDMLNLPYVRRLQSSASTPHSTNKQGEGAGPEAHYTLARPFENYPEEVRLSNLTAGSLRKPGMLAVPYVVLSKTPHGAEALGGLSGDAFAFVHLGRHLCGHRGIVHGGMLATVLDETLARTAFFHLPHHVGVTARLEIDYKWPVKADSVVVVETKTIEHEGRKAWIQATMRDLHGRTLAESRALFVEPKMARWLDLSAISSVMDMKHD